MKDYNCPNCGAPIGYQDKCDYCGTMIEWRPYVIHLAPQLYYHKTHEAWCNNRLIFKSVPKFEDYDKRRR